MENIKAVVFDFDGTLTHKNGNIWKELYISVGYPVDKNSSYHSSYVDFMNEKYDYETWVKVNETDFKNGGLTSDIFYEVSQNTKLIDGLEETLKFLQAKNIKMYVLSGNFVESIVSALGDFTQYFEEISANKIEFDEYGKLKRLIATKYDFKDKPTFLTKISKDLNINTSQICFVGNGENDVFAYESGAKTICINPENSCHETKNAWNHVIENSSDIRDILKYIN